MHVPCATTNMKSWPRLT